MRRSERFGTVNGHVKAKARQVACLPWRRRRRLEVLLITSRETRRWVIPKGWPIAGLGASGSAAREAFEEAGIEGRLSRSAIGSFSYDKRRADGTVKPTEVEVFALEVAVQHEDWPEHDERQCRWFPVSEAAAAVAEAGLRDLIRTFAGRARARAVSR
jgi:8-oxo-dGTP pyrophosphatase MutT (NUDIX family)